MKKSLVLLLLLVGACVLLPRAYADTITFSLADPIRNITTDGAALTFGGTIAADASNGGTVSFGGALLSITLPPSAFAINDSGFFSNVFSLNPGQSYTGDLFTLTLFSGLMPGTIDGSFSLLSAIVFDTVASDSFHVNVAPAAVTPEPSSLLLLGTGMLGVVGVMRRRFAC